MVMTSVVSGRHAVPVSEPVEPEVSERATRRVFSPQYKLRILVEYERRDRDGRGALLRREGLYTSSISERRRQRDEGALQALGASPSPDWTSSSPQHLAASFRVQPVRHRVELAEKVLPPASQTDVADLVAPIEEVNVLAQRTARCDEVANLRRVVRRKAMHRVIGGD